MLGGALSNYYLENGNNKYDDCTIQNVAFKGGEKLIYKAYYNWGFIWIPAGEATFEVIDNEDHFEVFIRGKSYKAYDGFFKLRDNFYSKINKQTLLPELFERNVNEGDYQKYEQIQFNQSTHQAQVKIGRTKETAIVENVNLNYCMHDLISLLYCSPCTNVSCKGAAPI